MAARPSGTEPKLKFYFFSYLPPDESQPVAEATRRLQQRLNEMAVDVFHQIGIDWPL